MVLYVAESECGTYRLGGMVLSVAGTVYGISGLGRMVPKSKQPH